MVNFKQFPHITKPNISCGDIYVYQLMQFPEVSADRPDCVRTLQ